MLSLVTVSPVITVFHSFCLSHHVFDQVNLWPAWIGFETAIFWQCSPGTVETQHLYPLRHGPQLPSWLRYIIVQRLHDRPLDLWNRMFNRHQAEITVMQFTGHSLPVHQSMSVPWEFFTSSHFISQYPPTRFPLITAIRMCHLLPVHHLGMAFLVGSKGQNITYIYIYIYMSVCAYVKQFYIRLFFGFFLIERT